MRRRWVIAPIESSDPELFDRVWEFDVGNDVISIGWSRLGNIAQMGKEELLGAVASAYPHKPRQTRPLIKNILWNFHHEIALNDCIVATERRKTLKAVGTVVQSAFYSRGKNPLSSQAIFSGLNGKNTRATRNSQTLFFQCILSPRFQIVITKVS